jgi:hypothetical protein
LARNRLPISNSAGRQGISRTIQNAFNLVF